MAMVHDDGSLVAAEIYDIGERLGFTVHQIRLVFARLVQEGLFDQEGRGRKAILRSTSRNELLHGPEVEWLRLAFAQDAGRAEWDKQWHLVAFQLDETRRAERTSLRDVLTEMAAAPLAGGLYVHALDWDDQVRSVAKELGIEANVTLATATQLEVGGARKPKEIAERLWPLHDIAAAYRAFIDQFAPSVRQKSKHDATTELAQVMTLVAAFEQCIRQDPLLPPQLLPKNWPGATARQVLREGSNRLAIVRQQASVPLLFSRYDDLFDELG